MSFPSTPTTKQHLDQGTDMPSLARVELVALIDKVNLIINSYAAALGICDLDSSGKVPAARLPQGTGSGVDADTLDGQHGTFYRSATNLNAGTLPAARFADASHGNRSGGGLHPAATQAVAGFMSAADKQALDGVPAAIEGTMTTQRVLAETAGAGVGAVGTYMVAWNSTTATVAAGGTVAGSSLRYKTGSDSPLPLTHIGLYYSNTFPTAGTSALAGTWRALVYTPGRSNYSTGEEPYPALWFPGLFLRIS